MKKQYLAVGSALAVLIVASAFCATIVTKSTESDIHNGQNSNNASSQEGSQNGEYPNSDEIADNYVSSLIDEDSNNNNSSSNNNNSGSSSNQGTDNKSDSGSSSNQNSNNNNSGSNNSSNNNANDNKGSNNNIENSGSSHSQVTPITTRAQRVKLLQDLVRSYAWPTFTADKTEQTSSYKYAARNISETLNHGNNGGVYVRLLLNNSGWDTSYKGTVLDQYNHMKNSGLWEEVTSIIKSNSDAQAGDVIIHPKTATDSLNSVLIYHGKISGFSSNMSGATKSHAPMANKYTDINHFINRGYQVFRLINAVTSVSLNKTNVTINVGQSVKLNATVLPYDASNKTITWKSTGTAVATVSNGVVTGKKAGSVTITATSVNGKKASAKVTVKAIPIAVTGITLNKNYALIGAGKNTSFTATITPSNATDKTITWKSSDTAIATVSNGKVTGKKAGTVTITATTYNGKKVSARVVVVSATRANKIVTFQNYVKNYAWPNYRAPMTGGDGSRMPRMAAYDAAIKKAGIDKRDGLSKGNNCGIYVRLLMKNSGWDPKYKQGSVYQQFGYLKSSSNWQDITDKINSNYDAQPGDVIIATPNFTGRAAGGTAGDTNHVLVYNGKISNFNSVMSSAASKKRAPMADEFNDIMHYKKAGFHIFRIKNVSSSTNSSIH